MPSNLLLTEEEHEAMASRLLDAQQRGRGIVPPPSETLPFTMDDAYRVRRRFVDKLIALGGCPKGHKIGFTSEAMQRMYGMSGPDFGQLLDTMFVPVGEPIAASQLADARVEPEIAFELARPLRGPGVTIAHVLDVTHCVRGAIEVIDSRVGAMRAKAVDSIADNAGAGKIVLGARALGPREVDLALVPISMRIDDEVQAARSGDVMGHPAAAVAWLANTLSAIDGLGGTLDAGHIVMSGSPTRSVAVKAGGRLHASFGPLGTIDIRFT